MPGRLSLPEGGYTRGVDIPGGGYNGGAGIPGAGIPRHGYVYPSPAQGTWDNQKQIQCDPLRQNSRE